MRAIKILINPRYGNELAVQGQCGHFFLLYLLGQDMVCCVNIKKWRRDFKELDSKYSF